MGVGTEFRTTFNLMLVPSSVKSESSEKIWAKGYPISLVPELFPDTTQQSMLVLFVYDGVLIKSYKSSLDSQTPPEKVFGPQKHYQYLDVRGL